MKSIWKKKNVKTILWRHANDAQLQNFYKDSVIKCKEIVIEHKDSVIERMDGQLEKACDDLEKVEGDLLKKKMASDTWARYNDFAILKLDMAAAALGEEPSYYAIRRQKKGFESALRKLKKRYPYSVMIYKKLNVPNGVNLFQRLKNCKLIVTSYKLNKFKICVKEDELHFCLNKLCMDF